MIKRGIDTTGSDFWAHLFPENESVFWYPVHAMRTWTKAHPAALTDGRSLDGAVTGRGYLCPRDLPFVMKKAVPRRMLCEFDWPRGTQRQRSQWGEEVVYWMLLVAEIRPPIWAVRKLETRREQYDVGDFELTFVSRPIFEVKTEGADYADSRNLFVQTEEGGHRATLMRVGGKVVERHTPLPGFKDD